MCQLTRPIIYDLTNCQELQVINYSVFSIFGISTKGRHSIEEEIEAGIVTLNRTFYANKKIKIQFYLEIVNIIKPLVTNTCEVWVLKIELSEINYC